MAHTKPGVMLLVVCVFLLVHLPVSSFAQGHPVSTHVHLANVRRRMLHMFVAIKP
jgi:hypothetical protein